METAIKKADKKLQEGKKLVASEMLSAEERASVEQQVHNALTGSSSEIVLNEMFQLGQSAMNSSKEYQSELDTKVNLLMSADSDVTKNLEKLREAAGMLSVKHSKEPGVVGRALARALAIVGVDLNTRRVQGSIKNYESAKKVMYEIIDALEQGREQIISENKSLFVLKNNLEEQQKAVLQDIYAIEVALQSLESGADLATDEHRQLREILQANLVDLKMLYSINDQYILTINQTRHSQRMQMSSVRRASGVTMKIAAIGMIIRASLENSRNVNRACSASQEFLSAQIVDNAEVFKEQVEETVRVSRTPLVQIEELKKAYDIINETLDSAAAQSARSYVDMKEVLKRLDQFAGQNHNMLTKGKELLESLDNDAAEISKQDHKLLSATTNSAGSGNNSDGNEHVSVGEQV